MAGPVPVTSEFLFQVVGEQHIELLILRARVSDLEQQIEQVRSNSNGIAADKLLELAQSNHS